MGSQGLTPRRLFCPRCSKPARVCLCGRLNFPPLDNPIAVTILQHSRETHHPLNSTRVAKIGLRNLAVIPVTDVNFHAHLLIRPIQVPKPSPSPSPPVDDDVNHQFTKYSVTCSSTDIRIRVDRSAKPDISWLLSSPVARSAVSNGFVVKKIQRKKQLGAEEEFLDFEEFEIVMPPGSALLFPSSKSIGLEAAADVQVKNLVVLDGTWAKATRIYHENPWLQLLPHLKLETGQESLYSEVRHQPKAGCLSTIESIVCAMKGLGQDKMEQGLDNLLDVFQSMVEDQRRCKDEKFRGVPLS